MNIAIDGNQRVPEQGSVEWLAMRRTGLGGSEISALYRLPDGACAHPWLSPLEIWAEKTGRAAISQPTPWDAPHLYVGRDREALQWARRSVLERPQHAVAHSWVAAAAANLGETESARAALAEFRRQLPSYTIASFRNERLCANDLCRSQRERYYAGLAKAGLPE